MQTYPFTIAALSFLIIATVFTALRKAVKEKSDTPPQFLAARRGDQLADTIMSGQINLIVIGLFLAYAERPAAMSFGYNGGEVPIALSFVLGAICYLVFIGAFTLVVKILGNRDDQLVAAYLAHRSIWPRTAQKRRKLVAALTLNPFTEELLYRGFLIYYLGNLLDSIVLFSALGIAVCLTIHVYQGVRMLPFHACFCIVSIVILFSPLGIVGCFGLHLVGDLLPLTQIKHQLKAWKAARRRERLTAA